MEDNEVMKFASILEIAKREGIAPNGYEDDCDHEALWRERSTSLRRANDEVYACRKWLAYSLHQKDLKWPANSYDLKHRVEYLYGCYVSNGAFLVAVHQYIDWVTGPVFSVKRDSPKSPNGTVDKLCLKPRRVSRKRTASRASVQSDLPETTKPPEGDASDG